MDKQISSLLQKFSLRADWAEKLLEMTETEKDKSAQSVSAFVLESQNQIRAINEKIQRLLDGYLEQDIEREIYCEKKQKNGNAHDYIYYHCTKKNKAVKCPEPCIRQEELDKQLSHLIQKVSLRADWAEKLLVMA